jgi:[acyl-carrier-protein] S-malonyltransferase
VANDNCLGQVVISGAKPAVERAMELAKAAGAKRALPLAVSIAAHSSLMNSIQSEWDAAVDAVTMRDASAPVYGNVAARALTSADNLRADIRAQMQSRVRWTESVQGMIRSGIRHFVEVGSGSVLIGLVKRIDSSVTGQALGNLSDFEAL